MLMIQTWLDRRADTILTLLEMDGGMGLGFLTSSPASFSPDESGDLLKR